MCLSDIFKNHIISYHILYYIIKVGFTSRGCRDIYYIIKVELTSRGYKDI